MKYNHVHLFISSDVLALPIDQLLKWTLTKSLLLIQFLGNPRKEAWRQKGKSWKVEGHPIRKGVWVRPGTVLNILWPHPPSATTSCFLLPPPTKTTVQPQPDSCGPIPPLIVEIWCPGHRAADLPYLKHIKSLAVPKDDPLHSISTSTLPQTKSRGEEPCWSPNRNVPPSPGQPQTSDNPSQSGTSLTAQSVLHI